MRSSSYFYLLKCSILKLHLMLQQYICGCFVREGRGGQRIFDLGKCRIEKAVPKQEGESCIMQNLHLLLVEFLQINILCLLSDKQGDGDEPVCQSRESGDGEEEVNLESRRFY